MSGQVAAADVYFIHGWTGDEDEEVNVDSEDSSGDGAACLRRLSCTNRASQGLVTSVGGTSDAREEECDSACINTVAAALKQVDHTEPVTCEDTGLFEEKAAINDQEMSADEMSPSDRKTTHLGKRLDARRFRNHFAAKLSGSKRLRTEAAKVRNPSPQSSERSTSEQEGALTLHVNLHVEQEKSTDETSNADSGFVDENENVNIEKAGRNYVSVKKEDESADIVPVCHHHNGEGTASGQSKRAKKESTKSDSASCTQECQIGDASKDEGVNDGEGTSCDHHKVSVLTEACLTNQADQSVHDGENAKLHLRVNSFKEDSGRNNSSIHINEEVTMVNDSGRMDDHDSVCQRCKHEGKLICCDGKNCKITYHIDCLDPPLKEVPPNHWYCPDCAYKRLVYGMVSVSKGIESIWDVKDGMDTNKAGCKATEKLYFVKYKGVSHAHNTWLPESQVVKESPKLLYGFKKKLDQGKPPNWDSEWTRPSRIIGKRRTMLSKSVESSSGEDSECESNSCIEWLVKWKNIGYEFCTWEVAEKVPGEVSVMKELIKSYEVRSRKTIQQDHHKKQVEGISVATLKNLKLKHSWMMGENVQHDCSEVIYKVCEFWQKRIPGIVLNEVKKERIIIAVGFLVCLLEEFQSSRPSLIIVPPALLEQWNDAIQKWMPTNNVVTYVGTKEAREIIKKYEFQNEDKDCIVQIIITSFDILNLDVEFWKDFGLETVIVDESQRLKGTRTSKSLRQLSPIYRLLLFSEPIKDTVDDYVHTLSLLSENIESQDGNGTLVELKTKTCKHIVYETKQENNEITYPKEFWIPVKLTAFQLQQYCKLFIGKSETLSRAKRGDLSSSPNELVLKVRECCNHPFLVNTCFQETPQNLSAKQLLDFGIQASGKLKLLDMMLLEAKASNKRVVVVTQIHLRTGKSSQMEILDDYMRQQFGVDSYERLDGGLPSSRKSAVVQRFNAIDSQSFVLLLDRRACGHSIRLRSVDCIIIFDSDWNPYADIQALLKIYSHGDFEDISICRLYCPYTLEERALIAARRSSELDANYHNFSVATCQKLLRWGVHKNFELLDKQKGSSKVPEEIAYSREMIKMLIDKCHNGANNVSGLCLDTAFCLRQGGAYNKGIPLFGERDEDLLEEDKIPATDFWTELLKDRQVEVPEAQVRELRARKKVQYYEDYFVPPITQDESDEEDSRRKRRKIPETIEAVGNSKTTKGVSGDGLCSDGGELDNVAKQTSAKQTDDVEKVQGLTDKPSSDPVEAGNSAEINAEKVSNAAAMSHHTGLDATATDAVAVKTEQQQLLLAMRQDLDKLCRALQFQPDTRLHVEQLLYSVGSFFKLPKDKSLLHAIELSLCWLAAEQQHYCIDRRATLSLAETCFGVQLDKIDTVYSKLEDRWKKRFEQGQPISASRCRENELSQRTVPDPNSRAADQEAPPHKDKGALVVEIERHLPKELAVNQDNAAAVPHDSQGRSDPSGNALKIPLEHEQMLQRKLMEKDNERRQALILSQKNQILKFEMIEKSLKQRLQKQNDITCFKMKSRQVPPTEIQKLAEAFKAAYTSLDECLKTLRINLIKKQHQERDKGNKAAFGNEDIRSYLEPDLTEKQVLDCLPQVLRAAIENGDFGFASSAAILERPNIAGPQITNQPPHPSGGGNTVSRVASGPAATTGETSEHQARGLPVNQRQWPQTSTTNTTGVQEQQSTSVPTSVSLSQTVLTSVPTFVHPVPIANQRASLSSPSLQPQAVSQSVLRQNHAQPDVQNIHLNSQRNISANETGRPPAANLPPSSIPTQVHSSANISRNGPVGRVVQNGSQARAAQPYQNDPLAQEYLRLRKEHDKLKSIHEAEKERIKAQFMKELEALSKRYETMLQEEDTVYNSKASALELNLKKVEMNRRLAEVFRLKMANDNQTTTSGAGAIHGHDPRVHGSVGQSQSFQQTPTVVTRLPAMPQQGMATGPGYGADLTRFHPQASSSAMERALERAVRSSMANMTTHAIAGSQPGVSPHVQSVLAAAQPRPVIATATQSPHVLQDGGLAGAGSPHTGSSTQQRITSSQQRMGSPVAGTPFTGGANSTAHLSSVQGQHVTLMSGNGSPRLLANAGVRVQTPPYHGQSAETSTIPCAPSNLGHGNVIISPEVASVHAPDILLNSTERAAHGSIPMETSTRPSSHNDMLQTNQARNTTSGVQNIVGLGSQNSTVPSETLMVPTSSILPNVVNGLSANQPRTLPDDIGSSAAFDVICLSDDDD